MAGYKRIIGKGIGFSPGSVHYIVTKGFSSSTAVNPISSYSLRGSYVTSYSIRGTSVTAYSLRGTNVTSHSLRGRT